MSFICKLTLALACSAGLASTALAQETLRVGAYPANPPWEFKNEAGTFEGFEVDVVTEIARRIGMTPQFTGLDFRALFVAAASRRVDMVISSLTITEERLQSQSFTQPYVAGALGIATKEGAGIASIEDLKGRRVGSIATSFPEIWIKEHEAELQLGSYSSYDSTANMLTDLRSGRIEAAVNDAVGLRHALTQIPGLTVAVEVPTDERFAIMMPKDSGRLAEVNDALSAMKEDGTMAAFHEKWFGIAPAASSLTVTPMPVPTAAE